jgi:hypothetical protein
MMALFKYFFNQLLVSFGHMNRWGQTFVIKIIIKPCGTLGTVMIICISIDFILEMHFFMTVPLFPHVPLFPQALFIKHAMQWVV